MATDMDAVMGPPSVSPPLSSGQPQSDSQQENIESQRNLKRRYNELEEEYNAATQNSGEPNIPLRAEIDNLREVGELDKMTKLGSNGSLTSDSATPQMPLAQASSSMSPSTAQNIKVRRLEAEEREQGRNKKNGDSTSVAANGSPRVQAQTSPDRAKFVSQPGTSADADVEMENGVGTNLHSPHPLNSLHLGQQAPADGAQTGDQQSPRRIAAQDIAAVAAAAAEAKASVPSGAKGTQADKVNPTVDIGTHQAQASTSTLADALGQPSSNSKMAPSQQSVNGGNLTSTNIASPSTPSHTQIIQHPPSMESILKVAEAAVAAQNAAKLASASSTPSNAPADPNLDPNLFSGSSSSASGPAVARNGNNTPNPASKPSPPPVNTDTTSSNATASSSTATPTSSTPTSSLSNNPYLSLSTNLLSRTPGSTTPTGHPMLMPYPIFYPPGTPVTPNSPSYPIPYNPYYYLAAPMPGPNGMYAPSPANFPLPAQQQQQQQRPPPPSEQQRAKPKRLKAHTVTTRSFSIPMVPRDKKGKPMLPLNVGIMTVINLGEVCMREHFHTERYIFPVGYEVTRRYLSTVDPTIEVVYHCTILDGGDGPKFQIIPSDRPDKPIIAGTATGAWSNIVKQANAIRNRQHSNSVSGPDFFGLGQNTIKHLIQELPNADRLRDYVWQNFVEGGPLGGRHAAVIPALPEEYDASLPLGAYYPKRDTNPNPNVPRGMSHYPQHIIAQAEAQKRLAAQQSQQQQQQQQQQPPPIAGPSGSGSASSSAPAPQHINPPNPQHDPAHIMLSLGATGNPLNIHEYQPPQNQNNGQSISEGADKRTTRSGGITNTNPPSSSSAPTTRQTRARGSQQQPQSGPTNVNGTEVSALEADGTMTTTFASIMNAYPAPGVSAPMPGQTTTSTS